MGKAGYTVRTTAATALAAGVAKTSLCVITPAQFGCDLKHIRLGFDGVTANAVPVLWELCTSTLATNSTPGTNNTSETTAIQQIYGRSITTGFTAFSSSAATFEPTALTVIDSNYLQAFMGLVIYDIPLGDTPDIGVSSGFVMRLTAPAVVNARTAFWFERC